VSHEIDIWVRLNPDTIYETTHILECKNWSQPAGTDEVYKLAGKMESLSAATIYWKTSLSHVERKTLSHHSEYPQV
jgi:hypothetical protein